MDSLKQRIENLENSFKNNKHENFEEEFSKMSPEELNTYIFKAIEEHHDPVFDNMNPAELHQWLMDNLRRPNENL